MSKLGPFSRRAADAPVVYPGIPTGIDIDAVGHGRDVPPERLSAAWALVGAWLADHGWSHLEVSVDRGPLDSIDFDLAAHGVPADLGLRSVFRRAIGLPLKPLPGQTLGYAARPSTSSERRHPDVWRWDDPSTPDTFPWNDSTGWRSDDDFPRSPNWEPRLVM